LRDIKGMYAKARACEIKGFTGMGDLYESPSNPDLVLSIVSRNPEENTLQILEFVESPGLVMSLSVT